MSFFNDCVLILYYDNHIQEHENYPNDISC